MMCVGAHVPGHMHGARQMTCGVTSFLLLSCVIGGPNSGHRTYIIWQEAPLPSEPPHCPCPLPSPSPFSFLLFSSLFLPVLLSVLHVAQDGLQFAMWARMTLNLWYYNLHLSHPVIGISAGDQTQAIMYHDQLPYIPSLPNLDFKQSTI